MRAQPTSEAWCADPPPRLGPTPIADEWPRGGLDPFDLGERRTQRLHLVGNGFCPAFVARGPFPDDRPADQALPRRRAVLRLAEKLAVAHRGALVAEWPRERARASGPFGAEAVAEGAHGPLRLAIRFQRRAEPWLAREPRRLERVRAGEGEVAAGSAGPLVLDGLGDDYARALDRLLGLSAVAGDEPLMLTHDLTQRDWS